MRSVRAFLGTRSLPACLAVVLISYPQEDLSPEPVLVELHALAPREVQSRAFQLATPQEVRIEAVGAPSSMKSEKVSAEMANDSGKSGWLAALLQRDPRPAVTQPWSGNAWILDLSSRRVVWELSASGAADGSGPRREFSGSVSLPAGSYCAFYAAFPDGEYWTDESTRTLKKQKWHAFGDEPLDQFTLVVRGNGRPLSASEMDRFNQRAAAATVAVLRGTSAEQFLQAGFILSRPTEIELVAEGEAREDGEFDYGWIANADTRETIWKLSWRDSEPAGGAAKNRIAKTSRLLPAGRYAAFYATDDSHDPSQWNTQPPHDPDAWGLSVAVRNPEDRGAVTTFAYEHVPAKATIAALTAIGNSAARTQGFALTRPMDVRIYALGEGRGGRMFDYGWITSAGSRAHLWEMRYDDTEPAGGDRKNRLVDTVLHLQPGRYVVHYVSDDSHSAEEWNAAAPPDGRHWGITILAANGALDRAAIGPYDEKQDPSILAQLSGIRDDDRARKTFSLTRESEVRIYAIGEGTGNEMYDYGWIEDARTGRRVWEMTYRSTQHAGGASKNRRFEGTVRLPAGEYVVHYQTDGSHAFGDWNAAPPDDPEGWGMTVYRTR
jgi:hypothetical protein